MHHHLEGLSESLERVHAGLIATQINVLDEPVLPYFRQILVFRLFAKKLMDVVGELRSKGEEFPLDTVHATALYRYVAGKYKKAQSFLDTRPGLDLEDGYDMQPEDLYHDTIGSAFDDGCTQSGNIVNLRSVSFPSSAPFPCRSSPWHRDWPQRQFMRLVSSQIYKHLGASSTSKIVWNVDQRKKKPCTGSQGHLPAHLSLFKRGVRRLANPKT